MQRQTWFAAALLLATACGQERGPASPSTAAQPIATAQSSLAAPQAPASPAAVTPATPAVAPAAAGAPAPAAGAVLFKGIPASRQPDGFFVLGRPEATALTDYSDFL